MADINKIVNDLEMSVGGSEIRDLVVEALSLLSQGKEAQSLGGTRYDDFVTMEEFIAVTPLLDGIDPLSDKGVKSKAIYEYLKTLKNAIDRQLLRGDRSDLKTPVLKKLKNVSDTINDIYYAIKEKQGITSNDVIFYNSPLSAYGNAIRNLQLEIEDNGYETLTVTKNGTYPEDGEDTIYSQINVNVTDNLITNKSVTQLALDGTLKVSTDSEASQENKAKNGYKKIDINIGGQLKNLSLDPSTILNSSGSPADLGNETSTIKAQDDGESLGFKEVSIDIRNKFEDLSVSINDEFVEQTFEAKTGDGIENNPSLYGYKTVTLAFESENKTEFTVRFHAKTTFSTTVPKHGTAVFPGSEDDLPDKPGYRFSGWNPEPIDVTRDLDCEPEYILITDTDPVQLGQSSISWKEIAEDGGIGVKVGEWKWVYANECFYEYSDGIRDKSIKIHIPPMAYHAYKVASNYRGATSVWFTGEGIPGSFTFWDTVPFMSRDPDESLTGWESCSFRKWLNGTYMGAIGSLEGGIYADCSGLQKAIKPMISPYKMPTGLMNTVEDRLWLPSATEAGKPGWNESGNRSLGLGSSACRSSSGTESLKTKIDVIDGKQITRFTTSMGSFNGDGVVDPGDKDKALEGFPAPATFSINYSGADVLQYYAFPHGLPDAFNAEINDDGGSSFNIQQAIFTSPRFGFGT